MINLYYGSVVNPQTLTRYLALPRCLIAVGSDGNIIWVEDDIEADAVHNIIATHGLKDGEFNLVDFTANPGEFLMPGLIDAHVHACQFPNLGVGGDLQLLDWLFEYVFPTESKFEDNAYAQRAYSDVIDRSIASGTTTSCYYGSLHLDATISLADIIHKKGQRAFVGKCNMDWNCPGYYIDKTPEASLRDTIRLIEHIQALPLSHAKEPLVHPIITPRFALSCSEKLLTDLGKLAASLPHVSIQTHISENKRETEDAVRRFGESYAGVYDRFGLLRNNTVLGHGVWLTEEEMKLIAERGAGVVHCPTSNFYLSSGMAKVGLMLDYGVKVALGTDVGGGYNPSILYAIQMASSASKMVALQAELDEERRQQWRAHNRGRHGKHHRRGKHGKYGQRGKHSKDARDRSDTSDSSSDSDSDSDSEAEAERRHKHHPREHYGGRGYSGRGHRGHYGHHGHPHPHHRPTPSQVQDQGSFANKKLQTETLLYLATLGGAHVCCLQDRIGSFAPGKAFDALYVTLDDASGNPSVWGAAAGEAGKAGTGTDEEVEKLRRWLERFLFGGDNRNLRWVFVQGVLVGGTDKRRGHGAESEA